MGWRACATTGAFRLRGVKTESAARPLGEADGDCLQASASVSTGFKANGPHPATLSQGGRPRRFNGI
jgi:hypothetical protein